MKKIRLVYRLLSFVFSVVTVFLINTFFSVFIKNKVNRQRKLSKLLRFISHKQIQMIGMKVKVQGLEHLKKNENYLIAANHVSYIDIPLLQSIISNNRFITHPNVSNQNFFLGLITKISGSYFIQRSIKNIRTELRETTDILKNGFHLIFFPEGTSTDGSKILPFYPLFFATAVYSKKPVLPIYINYTKIGDEHFNIKNHDIICWYGNQMGFKKHLFRLLQIKSIEVNIKILPPLTSENKKSRVLAKESREQIQKHFMPLDLDEQP